MSNNRNTAEQHGCIVCGRMYSMLVVYSPGGQMVDCTVTSAGGHRVRDAHRPLVACNQHSAAEVESALLKHYPGQPDTSEDED